MVDVYLDECYLGSIDNLADFVKKIKEDRAKGKLPSVMNVYVNENFGEVHLSVSDGRARRPLIVVENGKSRLTSDHLKKLEKNETQWKDLVTLGVIEYLDAAEEENAFIALQEEDITAEHTHVE